MTIAQMTMRINHFISSFLFLLLFGVHILDRERLYHFAWSWQRHVNRNCTRFLREQLSQLCNAIRFNRLVFVPSRPRLQFKRFSKHQRRHESMRNDVRCMSPENHINSLHFISINDYLIELIPEWKFKIFETHKHTANHRESMSIALLVFVGSLISFSLLCCRCGSSQKKKTIVLNFEERCNSKMHKRENKAIETANENIVNRKIVAMKSHARISHHFQDCFLFLSFASLFVWVSRPVCVFLLCLVTTVCLFVWCFVIAMIISVRIIA